MKVCNHCQQLLPLDKFPICKRVKSGLMARCRECKNKVLRDYRHSNPEVVKEQRSKYYKKDRTNPERILKTTWGLMKQRCEDKSDYQFHRYGGRGITVGWESYEHFKTDMLDAFKKALKEGRKTIDRIDNNKGYSKENCRFANHVEQANNTRRNIFFEYKGQRLTLAQICRLENVTYKNVWKRIKTYGWSLERSLY